MGSGTPELEIIYGECMHIGIPKDDLGSGAHVST